MKNYEDFHDGSFDGLHTEGDTAYAFVSTADKQRHVFVARSVIALLVNEMREGNIVLYLSIRLATEVTEEELAARMEAHHPYSAGGIDNKLLERARDQNLTALTIDPSYGATCFVFAKSFELLSYETWRRTI